MIVVKIITLSRHQPLLNLKFFAPHYNLESFFSIERYYKHKIWHYELCLPASSIFYHLLSKKC